MADYDRNDVRCAHTALSRLHASRAVSETGESLASDAEKAAAEDMVFDTAANLLAVARAVLIDVRNLQTSGLVDPDLRALNETLWAQFMADVGVFDSDIARAKL